MSSKFKPGLQPRTLFLSVYLPSFLLTFATGLLIPVLPLYVRSLGASFGVVSIVVAAVGLGTLIADVPSGLLIGRIGRRPAMILGTSTLVVASIALGLSVYVPELILFRLVSGMGRSLWTVSRHTFIAEEVPPRERGRALAMFGGVNRFGTFSGPVIGGLVGAQFGLNAPFFLYAAVAFIATILAFLFVPESRSHGSRPTNSLHIRTIGTLMRRHYRELASAGMAQVCGQMIRAGRQILIPLYGAYVVGLDVTEVGTIVSASSAIDMSLFYPAGLVMDRFGRRFAVIPSFLLLSIGMGLIPLTHSFVTLLGATLVLGFGNGLGSGSMMTLGADLAPRDQTGEFLGIWRLIGDAGTTGGPIVVGAVADAVGLSFAALTLSAIGLLAVGLFVVVVKETLQRAEPATVT